MSTAAVNDFAANAALLAKRETEKKPEEPVKAIESVYGLYGVSVEDTAPAEYTC